MTCRVASWDSSAIPSRASVGRHVTSPETRARLAMPPFRACPPDSGSSPGEGVWEGKRK